MSIDEKNKCIEQGSRVRSCLVQASEKSICKLQVNSLIRGDIFHIFSQHFEPSHTARAIVKVMF